MGFESGRANYCNRFRTILEPMQGGSAYASAQDVRVEQPRATASVRIPTNPSPAVPALKPRRELVGLAVVGLLVFLAVEQGGFA